MTSSTTDSKQAFDRVWPNGLWQVLRDLEEGLDQVMQVFYDHSSSTVLLNIQLGEFFQNNCLYQTMVPTLSSAIQWCPLSSAIQWCLLSPGLFNAFPGENHARYPPRPPHLHRHRGQT